MGLLSWFSKSSAPDYETLLARLSSEIEDSKSRLAEIRLRERRWALLINAYGIGVWAMWTGLWWMRGLPLGLVGWESDSVEARAAGTGGVAAGPFLLWTLNKALHFIFARQRNSSEAHLRLLLTRQRKHVDEIKKATNYDSTRKLLERYDESVPTSPPQGGMGMGMGMGMPPSQTQQTRGTGSAPTTPVKNVKKEQESSPSGSERTGSPRAPGHLVGAGGTPVRGGGPAMPMPVPGGLTADQAAVLHMQMQAIHPFLPTPEKKWYDRIVDSILGDDPTQGAQSKYALVCGECFRHNGLVGSQYEWERMQWICPRCNHMNPPPLSRLEDPSNQPHAPPQRSIQVDPAAPVTPPHLPRASPRPRRQPGERATPRSSRLGQEVFSASNEEEEHDQRGDDEGETMDVDDEK